MFLLSAPPAFGELTFQQKLSAMLRRAEMSIEVISQQITESQTAPFLGDLYLQLADLLAQKANILYYVQMEKEQQTDLTTRGGSKFASVVHAQKEAVGIYRQILKEFPKFDKKHMVLFRLSLSLKSIDEAAAFLGTVNRLIKEYPLSREAIQGRLLLGQYYYEKMEYSKAMPYLREVALSKHAYERNQAKFRIGVIYSRTEKYKSALDQFEQIALDESLEEDNNPMNISLKNQGVKADLKREALLESIRPYTYVYPKDPKPVKYYARLAPSELHFYEVIEKLAFRYIVGKQYNHAVKLLRTLSEMTVDPEKVVNIYQEVLTMIPIKDRVDIKVTEIQFLLEKFNVWFTYFEVSPKYRDLALNFMEVQLRDLGTKAHSFGKGATGTQQKYYLEKARDFYLLYLGFFKLKNKNTVKVAMNLADVYFRMGDYVGAGNYFLRVFDGEFGPPPPRNKLLDDAMVALQKKKQYNFYDHLRSKGLLIAAIRGYMQIDPKKKNSDKYNFTLVKAKYDQGQYKEAIPGLYNFMKAFPATKYATDAGDLILDYYNTRSDFKNLQLWCGAIQRLPIKDKRFMDKVATIKETATGNRLNQEVKSLGAYDEFTQGKSYLEFAQGEGQDERLVALALQQALAKSKAERDIDTFFMTAKVMADKESDLPKKADILNSIASESLSISKYYEANEALEKILDQSDHTDPTRIKALEQQAGMALLLKDWKMLEDVIDRSEWSRVSETVKTRADSQMADVLESPVEVPGDIVSYLIDRVEKTNNDPLLLALWKAQHRMSSGKRSDVKRAATARCAKRRGLAVCRWMTFVALEDKKEGLIDELDDAPTKPEKIEQYAAKMMGFLEEYKKVENSGDMQLNVVLAVRYQEVYKAFGDYLQKVGNANRDLKDVLTQKAKESRTAGSRFLGTCQKMVSKSTAINPSGRFCWKGGTPSVEDMLEWSSKDPPELERKDPMEKKIMDQRKEIFVSGRSGERLLNMAKTYYDSRYYYQASAVATYGISLYPKEKRSFHALAGCSAVNLGLYNEAVYHLDNASAYGGLKSACQTKLKAIGLGK